MNPQMVRIWTLCLLFFAALGLVVGLTIGKADASVPSSVTCSDEWQHANSGEAKTCREMGWLVTSKYVVTPGRVLRYSSLPSCLVEDGSTNKRACSWNVHPDDGNGVGRSYLALSVPGGKRYVYLRDCYGVACR